jgi:small basic protein
MTLGHAIFIVGLVIGIVIGWVWRTGQAISHHECFNLDHEDET